MNKINFSDYITGLLSGDNFLKHKVISKTSGTSSIICKQSAAQGYTPMVMNRFFNSSVALFYEHHLLCYISFCDNMQGHICDFNIDYN